MVSLETIESSNGRIKSALPARLVAVFIGATRGIGEATMRQFVVNVEKPKIYFTGRSRENGEKVTASYKELNPGGEYIFIQADNSLIVECDKVCDTIKEHETAVNLLFMSSGALTINKDTSEGLPYIGSLTLFSRIRITTNLLPLLSASSHLRRVVSVFAGTKEGFVDLTDLAGTGRAPFTRQRGQMATMTMLAFESLAKQTDGAGVSFVHSFPGLVKTDLGKDEPGAVASVLRVAAWALGPLVYRSVAPLEEVGKRHLYLATSASFAADAGPDGVVLGVVPLPGNDDDGKMKLTERTAGDGPGAAAVYATDAVQESGQGPWRDVLAKLRSQGGDERIMTYLTEEFNRIVGRNG